MDVDATGAILASDGERAVAVLSKRAAMPMVQEEKRVGGAQKESSLARGM